MVQTSATHPTNDERCDFPADIQPRYDIPSPFQSQYQNHSKFRDLQGQEYRKKRLRELWEQLPNIVTYHARHPACLSDKLLLHGELTPELAKSLKETHDAEPLSLSDVAENGYTRSPSRKAFKKYVEEVDGCLNMNKLSLASDNADPNRSPKHISPFITHSTRSQNSSSASFSQVRDFLLRLPRKLSTAETYPYYDIRKLPGVDRPFKRIDLEDSIGLNSKGKPPDPSTPLQASSTQIEEEEDVEPAEEVLEEEEPHTILDGHTSLKFLLAGGMAGVVSRTCTAPFDRIKVFLITSSPCLHGSPVADRPSVFNATIIKDAASRIYAEGGLLAFWTGNGLSVAKIMPESAIKFFTYESAKRTFARYWDHVDDPRKISGTSRFIAGGIGGISAQLSIYPIETVKTQMMSSMGQKRNIAESVRHVYSMGGIRAFYRGLTIGLIGVFPYAAIDMSTFEALKLAYIKSTGKEEPGVLALLSFGSISGSIGAISVYPLNLTRTRLQASGSPGHPQRYNGVLDVAVKTWERDGWRGFYRGLLPTLAKVVPSVSISYVVYEYSKRKLGV